MPKLPVLARSWTVFGSKEGLKTWPIEAKIVVFGSQSDQPVLARPWTGKNRLAVPTSPVLVCKCNFQFFGCFNEFCSGNIRVTYCYSIVLSWWDIFLLIRIWAFLSECSLPCKDVFFPVRMYYSLSGYIISFQDVLFPVRIHSFSVRIYSFMSRYILLYHNSKLTMFLYHLGLAIWDTCIVYW